MLGEIVNEIEGESTGCEEEQWKEREEEGTEFFETRGQATLRCFGGNNSGSLLDSCRKHSHHGIGAAQAAVAVVAQVAMQAP